MSEQKQKILWLSLGIVIAGTVFALLCYFGIFSSYQNPAISTNKGNSDNASNTRITDQSNEQKGYQTAPLLDKPVNFSSLPKSWGKLTMVENLDAKNNDLEDKNGIANNVSGWETSYSLESNLNIKIGVKSDVFRQTAVTSRYHFVIDRPTFNLDNISNSSCYPGFTFAMGCTQYSLFGKGDLEESISEPSPIYEVKVFYTTANNNDFDYGADKSIQKYVVVRDGEKSLYYVWVYSYPIPGDRDDLIEYQKLETMIYNTIHKPSAGLQEFDRVIEKFLQDNSVKELDPKKY